jgi:hypothetical protein
MARCHPRNRASSVYVVTASTSALNNSTLGVAAQRVPAPPTTSTACRWGDGAELCVSCRIAQMRINIAVLLRNCRTAFATSNPVHSQHSRTSHVERFGNDKVATRQRPRVSKAQRTSGAVLIMPDTAGVASRNWPQQRVVTTDSCGQASTCGQQENRPLGSHAP